MQSLSSQLYLLSAFLLESWRTTIANHWAQQTLRLPVILTDHESKIVTKCCQLQPPSDARSLGHRASQAPALPIRDYLKGEENPTLPPYLNHIYQWFYSLASISANLTHVYLYHQRMQHCIGLCISIHFSGHIPFDNLATHISRPLEMIVLFLVVEGFCRLWQDSRVLLVLLWCA